MPAREKSLEPISREQDTFPRVNSILDWIVSIYEINRKHWYHPLVGMTLSHWLASFDLRFTGSRARQLLTNLRNQANKTPRTWSLK
ncbi:hypothetical protein V6N11_002900 [Hibiscus sabdariffa]|uniref:Uncharacterized protein n=1 Tax=Hibiscus sabdariffa TaxID=183260 RepID=A0ABR2SBN5_9ROSI